MASYTPTALIGPSSWTTGAVNYSSAGGTSSIVRTVSVIAPTASGRSFTLTLGASGAGTIVFATQALTVSVTSIFNGWWVGPANSASSVSALSDTASANSVVGTVAGYVYG